MNSISFLVSVFALVSLGCKGDVQVGPTDEGGDKPDAKPGGGGGGGGEDCIDIVTPNGNGKHSPGKNCLNDGCHDGTGNPPKWTIAGTLYKDKAGTAPVGGATLLFTDANNAEIKLVTASNGNFYTADQINFPIKAKATGCPNSKSMNGEITADMAGCNKSGCHVADKRVYLP